MNEHNSPHPSVCTVKGSTNQEECRVAFYSIAQQRSGIS